MSSRLHTKQTRKRPKQGGSVSPSRARKIKMTPGFSETSPVGQPHTSNVRDFIRAMSVELSLLAYRNGLDSLAVVFDMAREVADSDTVRSRMRERSLHDSR